MKLNRHVQFDIIQSMMMTRWDNDMTYRIGTVYTEIETELLWLIE